MNNKAKVIRQSNFEALRIVAMLMIILNHSMLLGTGYVGYIMDHPYSYDEQGVLPVFINSATVLSVNTFVLISGWFGIHRVVKSAIRILIDIAIYGLASYILCSLVMGNDLSLDGVWASMSIANWWYPYTYLILVFMSPVLEMALVRRTEEGTHQHFRRITAIVLAFAVIDLFFGWQCKITDMNGYNVYVFHFMFLYALARLLRVYLEEDKERHLNLRLLSALFLFSVSAITCGFVYKYGFSGRVSTPGAVLTGWFAHNNPLMIMSSFTLFAIFAQLRFKLQWINIVATTVFGIYLTHTSPTGTRPITAMATYLFDNWSYVGLIVCTIIVFCVYGMAVYAINAVKDPVVGYVLTHASNWLTKRNKHHQPSV